MTLDELGGFLGGMSVAAVIAALAAAARYSRRMLAWLRRWSRVMDELLGVPEGQGVPARPGVLEQLAEVRQMLAGLADLPDRVTAVEERVGAVEAQMKPNGGTTFYDQVRRATQPAAPTTPAPPVQRSSSRRAYRLRRSPTP